MKNEWLQKMQQLSPKETKKWRDVISLIGYQIDSNNGILLKEFVNKYIDAYYSKQNSSIIFK